MDLMDVRPSQMVWKGREDAGWVAAHGARRARGARRCTLTLPTRRALRLFPDPLKHARRVVDVAADVGQKHFVAVVASVPNERVLWVVLVLLLVLFKRLHADRAYAPIVGVATVEERHCGLGEWVIVYSSLHGYELFKLSTRFLG